MSIKKVMIAGTKSGVGKSTISMGLMAALSKKMNVQPYKVGPDYIDGSFHTYITNNVCRNLDSYLLDENIIKDIFSSNSHNKDISIIEGVMGLFDGAEIGSDVGTSSSIAKILNTPIILVVDGSKVASSIAAIINGFNLFDDEIKISGVIINNVGSKKHYDLLKSAILYHTNVIPCGYLLKNSDIEMPERHLGLVPACEANNIEDIFNKLSKQIEDTVDLDTILQLSIGTDIKPLDIKLKRMTNGKIKIAIARDKAFNFYYQDSLDYLSSKYSVTWVPFSPIYDKKLPKNIDGIYIGGGFPEMFANQLSKNSSMKQDIKKHLESGIPYYAECGGLMYLTESITTLSGINYPMIGWFSGGSIMTKRLQNFGYAKITLKEDSVLGSKGDSVKVHEFHRSKVNLNENKIFTVNKNSSGNKSSWECGYKKNNGVAGYAHIHLLSNPSFGKSFVDFCLQYQKEK